MLSLLLSEVFGVFELCRVKVQGKNQLSDSLDIVDFSTNNFFYIISFIIVKKVKFSRALMSIF